MAFDSLLEGRFGDDFHERELAEFAARVAAGEVVLNNGPAGSTRFSPEASSGDDPFYSGPRTLGNAGVRGTGLQFMPEQSNVIA
jgi:hypothetical protein